MAKTGIWHNLRNAGTSYLVLGATLLFTGIICIWPSGKPQESSSPPTLVITVGYLALSPELGQVRVIPWSGHELRSLCSDAPYEPVSPIQLEDAGLAPQLPLTY